jgi:hypothetical protein
MPDNMTYKQLTAKITYMQTKISSFAELERAKFKFLVGYPVVKIPS